MLQNFNPSSTFILCVLLCMFFTRNIDAGKGKVPIYMPIPIPIPMPIGPTGGGAKFHHQQQLNQRDDGEGEVKKIYLLQPMPKMKPPPQLKGGFMGPVQTHIHMSPSPGVLHPQKPRSSHGGVGSSNHDGSNEGGSGHKTSYSDMKILPIVVIPPIAPMPPIHVPSSNTNSHTPRMTLTPQFNNYVVSSSSDPAMKSSRSHMSSSMTSGYPQDDRSFSDYGASFGSSMRRGSHMSRGRSGRGRHPGRQVSMQGQYRSASKARYNRFQDDQRDGDTDDFDYIDSRRSSYQPRGRRTGSSSRYRSYHEPSDHRSRMSNSIRDVINQHTVFDDDLTYPLDGGSSVSEPINRSNRDCCSESNRARQYASSQPVGETNLDLDQREALALIDKDYSEQRGDQMIKSRYQNSFDDTDSKRHAESLNNAYYDRDVLDDDSINQRSNSKLDGNGRRLYPDDRDIFDDDNWSFDTIKSVSHVSPTANATVTSPKIEPSKHNTTTTSNLKSDQSIRQTLTTTTPPIGRGQYATDHLSENG